MKKQYTKPTAEVIVLGTDDFCDYGFIGDTSNPTDGSKFTGASKGTSTWEDED